MQYTSTIFKKIHLLKRSIYRIYKSVVTYYKLLLKFIQQRCLYVLQVTVCTFTNQIELVRI